MFGLGPIELLLGLMCLGMMAVGVVLVAVLSGIVIGVLPRLR